MRNYHNIILLYCYVCSLKNVYSMTVWVCLPFSSGYILNVCTLYILSDRFFLRYCVIAFVLFSIFLFSFWHFRLLLLLLLFFGGIVYVCLLYLFRFPNFKMMIFFPFFFLSVFFFLFVFLCLVFLWCAYLSPCFAHTVLLCIPNVFANKKPFFFVP